MNKIISNVTLVFRNAFTVFIGVLAGVNGAVHAGVEIAQSPLNVGSEVPGNLAIVASVEYPTVISVANLARTYTPGTRYVGYFDSSKCYKYHYSDEERDRYFYPVASPRADAGYGCDTSQGVWAGNFLNWAATQTIDPFRSALTGGYRVRDTVNETILEKAVADYDFPGISRVALLKIAMCWLRQCLYRGVASVCALTVLVTECGLLKRPAHLPVLARAFRDRHPGPSLQACLESQRYRGV